MKNNKLLLYGASGHAKVIVDSARSAGFQVAGIFDDDETKKELDGLPVFAGYEPTKWPQIPLIISIGDNKVRYDLSKRIIHTFFSIVHPEARISHSSIIGVGTVIFNGSIIQTGSKIGNHAIINTAAVVDHDCMIGNFAHIAPNATVCGGVKIGEGVKVSAGAVIIPGMEIGDWAVIGAGAIITKNVEKKAIVVGDRGRIIGYNN